jgi:hypothetical protein
MRDAFPRNYHEYFLQGAYRLESYTAGTLVDSIKQQKEPAIPMRAAGCLLSLTCQDDAQAEKEKAPFQGLFL